MFYFYIDKRIKYTYNKIGCDGMEVNNPLYKNIGIHVIASIFTVEKGVVKVLLIRRKNDPYKNQWALVGGALYNNEELNQAINREIFEKTGMVDINVSKFEVFGKVDRSPIQRMIAIGYIGVIDTERVNILKETLKTSDADWFPLDKIPKLAYDHEEILKAAIDELKKRIGESNILKSLYPEGFTMPEIQKVYETILNKTFDKRNFRKKILSLGIINDTKKFKIFEGTKPAKFYKFKAHKKSKNVL